MNRILKFRVWDKEKQRMRYDVTGFEHGKENEMAIVFCDGDPFHMSNVVRDFPTDTSVMQFTGLKDKNGVEIYEDSIWQSSSDTKTAITTGKQVVNTSWRRGTIDFVDGAFRQTLRLQENAWFGELPHVEPIFVERGIAGHIEIIGNIYENKSLLSHYTPDQIAQLETDAWVDRS